MDGWMERAFISHSGVCLLGSLVVSEGAVKMVRMASIWTAGGVAGWLAGWLADQRRKRGGRRLCVFVSVSLLTQVSTRWHGRRADMHELTIGACICLPASLPAPPTNVCVCVFFLPCAVCPVLRRGRMMGWERQTKCARPT